MATVHPTIAVLERHMLLYRRLWRSSVFSFFVLPALFLLNMGFGVGSYVPEVDHTGYADWIAPGLLSQLAFQIAVSESTMGVYTDFEWIGAFHVMGNTRVSVRDMIGGWFLYVLVVVELAVTAFLVVMWPVGILRSSLALAAPFVCALLGVSVAAPTTAFAATVRDESNFHLLTQFGVIPATLVSGIFFPVGQLPALLRPLAYASPLWHAAQINRAVYLGTASAGPLLAHTGYLLAWTVLGAAWARWAFHRRLDR